MTFEESSQSKAANNFILHCLGLAEPEISHHLIAVAPRTPRLPVSGGVKI
jgi:hypothetical protein